MIHMSEITDETFEHALLVKIGRGGKTIHKRGRKTESGLITGRRQGYWDADELIEEAVDRDLPVIDSRAIPEDVIAEYAVDTPMLATHPDEVSGGNTPVLGNMDKVPPQEYIEIAQEYGADVYNEDEVPEWEVPEDREAVF